MWSLNFRKTYLLKYSNLVVKDLAIPKENHGSVWSLEKVCFIVEFVFIKNNLLKKSFNLSLMNGISLIEAFCELFSKLNYKSSSIPLCLGVLDVLISMCQTAELFLKFLFKVT